MKDVEIHKYVQRSCKDRATRAVLLQALEAGATMKATKGGVMVHGPDGMVSAHFTVSDHRAYKNLRSRLRRAGLPI